MIGRRTFLALSGAALAAPQSVLAAPGPASASLLVRKEAGTHRYDALKILDQADQPVLLETFRGKTVVLNLWAPWCGPCRREMPSLSRLSSHGGNGQIAVLPLGFTWQGAAAINRFYRETGITNLPVLIGDGENVQAVTGHSRLPTTLILDRNGYHAATVLGEAVWDDDATIGLLSTLA